MSHLLSAIVGLAAALGLAGAVQAQCAYAGGGATISVPGRPFAAVATKDGCWLFASLGLEGASSGGVAVLKNEGGRFRLARVAPLPDEPGGLTLAHDGLTLIVAAGDSVQFLDVELLKTGASDPRRPAIPMKGAGAVYVAAGLDDRLVFVSEEARSRVGVLTLAPGPAVYSGFVPTGRAPVGLALSKDGTRLYATSQVAPTSAGFARRCKPPRGDGPDRAPGVLAVIDVTRAAKEPAGALVAMAEAGCGPVRVALSPDGATAWVTARSDNALLAFPTAELTGLSARPNVTATEVGSAPVGVAARRDGRQVWVANSDRFKGGRGSLSGVSPAGGAQRRVASGKFPRDIAFLPDGKTLVVAQYDSQALQFVPTD